MGTQKRDFDEGGWYRELFDNLNDCVVVYRAVDAGADFRIEDINQAGQRLEKVSRDEAAGRLITQVFPGVERYGLLDVLRRVWRSGRSEQFPLKLYKDQRITGWRENYVFRLPQDLVVAVYTDQFERRRTEERLRLSEERYRTLVEAQHAVAWKVDPNTRCYLIISPGIEELTGYPMRRWMEEPGFWLEQVHPEDRDYARGFFDEVLNNGKQELEYRMLTASGKVIWLRDKVKVIRDEAGRPLELVGAMVDVTAHRALEAKLEQQVQAQRRAQSEAEAALAAAERANRAKTVFLTNMSHEIRTPLNAILGFAHLVGMGRLDAQQRDHLKGVVSSSENLLRIMNDILDFSRMEAGELRVEQTSFCVDDILDNLSSIFGMAAGGKGVELLIEVDPHIPCMLQGDPLRIGQVLRNLISNALKFTEEGSVVLSLRADGPGQERLRLRFEVTDTGIGIAPEQLGPIFDAFAQGDDSTTRRFGGTGLGLAISDQLAGMMGGLIEVDSAPGEGSRFSLILALPADGPTRLERLQAEELSGRRVLLMAYPGRSAEIFSATLESFGLEVKQAADCATASSLLSAEGAAYDLLVVDWRRNARDFAEFTSWVQQAMPQLTIVVLNDYGIEQWRKWFPGIAVSAVLAKSVSPQRLFTTLRELVRAQAGVRAQADAQTEARGAVKAAGPRAPQLPGFRLDEALARFGGELDLLQEVLASFVDRASALRAAIAGAAERGDVSSLREQAHLVKGMAGNIAAYRVYEAAAALENGLSGPGAAEPPPLAEAAAGLLKALEAVESVRAKVPRPPQRVAAVSAASVEGAVLADERKLTEQLEQHLRRHNIRAESVAEALLTQYAGTLAEAPVRRLLDQLTDFDFAGARECLPEVVAALDHLNAVEMDHGI